jgi:transposase
MNSFVFLEWFENQLMPALKNPSLVVLDNASYHNVKKTFTSRTCMQNNQTFALPEGIFGASDPSFGSHI